MSGLTLLKYFLYAASLANKWSW